MLEQKTLPYQKSKNRFFYGYVVLAAATLIMMVMYGTRAAFGVFFKPMLTEFGWTRALTSGALSLSMIIQGSLAVVMGGLNDRLGPRIVLTFCGLLSGIGCLLMSQINTVWQMYLFYGVIIGIGMSGIFVPILSTIARWFIKRRNMMSGIALAGISIGSFIAPPAANWMITTYDWRVSYILIGCIILVIGLLSAQFLKRDPNQTGQMPFGIVEGESQDLYTGDEGLSLKDATGTWQFWMLFLIFICLGFCFFSIMVHIVPHVTDLGISTKSAANILAAMSGSVIIGNIVMGGIADRIGSKQVCIIGLILTAIAVFWLVSIKEVWMFYAFVFIFGVAHGGCIGAESPLVAWLFGMSSHGMLLGIISCGFTVGAAIGPLFTGYIFDSTGSYKLAFITYGIISLFGFIMAILIRPIKENVTLQEARRSDI
ncbi:MFS transporter [Thermodesulfobacteriota bacterium]